MPEILVGQKFEKLTVLEKAGTAKYGILWRCICECGNYTNVLTVNLNRRHTKSCGCLHNPQFMPKITKKELSALEGELLGDGSIPSVKKGNCRFLLQTVYYGQAKFANDNILSTQPTIKCYQRKASKLSNYKNNSKTDIINVWTVRSKRSPFFNSLRKLWYPNDKKIVPDNFKLNNISALH